MTNDIHTINVGNLKYLPVLNDLCPDHLHQWALHSRHPQHADPALGIKEDMNEGLRISNCLLETMVNEHG